MASGGKLSGVNAYFQLTRGLVDENLNYIGYRDNWEVVHTLERWGIKMTWDDGTYHLEGDNLRFHGGQLKRGIARALTKSSVMRSGTDDGDRSSDQRRRDRRAPLR